jgi:hypothetical protein
MHRSGLLVCILACGAAGPAAPAAAQWSVAIDAAATVFSGASRDTTLAEPTGFHPHRPTLFAGRVDRRVGRLGVGLAVGVAGADLIEEGPDAGAVVKHILDLVEVAPEVSLLVAATPAGAALRVHAGPLVDVWSPDGGDDRTRVGGHAAASLEWPIAGRLAGVVRAGAAVTGSLFNADELPPGFVRRAMWRRTVSLGARYRL